MTLPTTLRGITWRHSRGYVPVVAGSACYEDRWHGDVRVEWDQRSLWDFGEGSLAAVAERYDLLVIDHPLVGDAVDAGLLAQLPPAALPRDAVGESQRSYDYAGGPWVLALDAACQVATWRSDLMHAADVAVPETVDDVINLPASVAVAMPMAPVDLWCTWLSLCASLDGHPFANPDRVVSRDIADQASDMLARLVRRAGQHWLGVNPIAVLRQMSSCDGPAYVPFTFGYSNYARAGFCERRLTWGPAPATGSPSRTALGGAGIAVSARGAHVDVAIDVAAWLASPACQAGPYLEAGGQPAHRAAWTSLVAAELADGYFADTLPALERAFSRPTLPGMTEFQTAAGEQLFEALRDGRVGVTQIAAIDAAWSRLGRGHRRKDRPCT